MSFFKDNEYYEVTVMDLSSPSLNTFSVGVNGEVKTYPTNKKITLSGVEINILQNALHEQAEVKAVDGLNEIVGHTMRPRFAVNVMGFGSIPAQKAVDLSKPVAQETKAPVAEVTTEDEAGGVLPPAEKVTSEERKQQLEAATRQELIAFCNGEGIPIQPTDNKNVLMARILKFEGLWVK